MTSGSWPRCPLVRPGNFSGSRWITAAWAGRRLPRFADGTGEADAGTDVAGESGRAGDGRARSGDPGAYRRGNRGHLDRDLRLRPAPVRGPGTVSEPWGRARARGHGRGDRGRRGRYQPG